MKKKKHTPVIIGAAVIGLGLLAYYIYKRKKDGTDGTGGEQAPKVGKYQTTASVYKIGMKRPGAN